MISKPKCGARFLPILGEIVQRLNDETHKALALLDARERFASLGATLTPSGPAELRNLVKRDSEKWAKLIKEMSI